MSRNDTSLTSSGVNEAVDSAGNSNKVVVSNKWATYGRIGLQPGASKQTSDVPCCRALIASAYKNCKKDETFAQPTP